MKKALTILLLLVAQRGFSQLVYDTRNDAGAGLTSGFFETNIPVNYPNNSPNVWWHLIDVRHTNPNNNYRMQFAGTFVDQKLFFRKTNNIPTAPWSKILMETAGNTKIDGGVSIGEVSAPAAGGLSIGNLAVDYTPTNVNYFTTGSTLFLNSKDFSTIGFHDTGTRVDFIRVGQGTIKIGFNGGWGEPNVGLPGNGIWNNAGNVGIGTTTPQERLSVNGNIRAHQVKVETTGWPDYVFSKNYELPSLKTLATYINQNQHLPEIPTAMEMEKEGINLGDMNKILVKKVEELTLYLIEGDKRAKEQQEQISKLNEKLDMLLNCK